MAVLETLLLVVVHKTDFSAPAYGDSDGIIMLDIPFMATPSAANNEFSLAFT